MEFSTWCSEREFDETKLTEAQRKTLLAQWKRDVTPKDDPPIGDDPARRAIDATRAKEQRVQEIGEMIAAALMTKRINADTGELIAHRAEKENWNKLQVENEILKCERPQIGVPLPRMDVQHKDEVIEAAVCMTGGLDTSALEKHYKPEVLEAAHSAYRHGLPLSELLLTYAKRSGYNALSVKSNIKSALQAAFTPDLRAAGSWGPSTGGGLSGVLSNVANKFLRAGFDSVETVWRRISAIGSVTDFKARTVYSLTGGLTYDKVGPSGEIKHGQVGAETYTNQADTYAKMLGLDRRDIINDDLGALTQVGRRLGRGGALKINDVFWTIFLNNSAFFTSGRNNVSTGAGSALSIAGLDAANGKFKAQTDPDGNPAGYEPAILLVPTALESTALTLMQSMGLTVGSGTAAAGSTNIWAGRFRTESSAYMSNSNYTGNSTAAWYLLANPQDAPVIEVVFLNGNESPTVETADADFGMLGIALRGYHDFGCSFQEYRAGVRSAGS